MEQVILETAERLFLERGYALVSISEIAREAGCNQALVHYYYRTKETLFQRIFQQKARAFISGLFTSDHAGEPFAVQLGRIIERHFSMMAASPGLPWLIVSELRLHPERIAAIKEQVGEEMLSAAGRFEALLKAEIAAGRVRQIELFDLLMTVVSLNAFFFIAEPVFTRVLDMDPAQVESFVQQRKKQITETALNSLRP